MKINHFLKVALIALPIAITGCSSSSKDDGVNTSDGNYPYLSSDPSLSSGMQAALEQLKENNTLYFGFDRFDLQPQYSNMLNAHASFLRANPSVQVTIEGHADERGTPEYNIALGERRANAVKMYLQGRGVSARQVEIVSYGKEKPAVYGHTEDAYSQNRRAIIIY